ncbi:hypothetical protein ASPFODRAFT_53514 [Aspergillus luchuensis CBS 106.47]|uniref:Uncharacterized protein n=1 Tax=Aspergillus luchuensis (strain CBS 106.47) TaxID=1137211 RepID=A0A1M3T0U1_ASPLC|nr:hypothetical protein ASPFODRAFT_53514 [Aspergillus luchuensis CBS 106.47]
MGYLSASDVAALYAALEIQPSETVRKHYLHPLRDVDPTMQIFQSWLRVDCQIFIIGPDTLLLKERIQNSKAYYQHHHPRKPPQLEAWVVGIPPTSRPDYRGRAGRVTRLNRVSSNKREDINVGAKALIDLDKILLRTLRQCMCRHGCEGSNDNTFTGDSIQAKYFNLIDCVDTWAEGRVSLRVLGMQFRLRWNIDKGVSLRDYWTPKDGMPYIDAAYPFCPQFAAANRTYRGSPRKHFGDRDAALIFNCHHLLDIDERWTVSIQTNVFRDGLF